MKTVRNLFIAGTLLILVLGLPAPAQTASDQTSDSPQSSSSTTNLQDQSGAANPTRLIHSHQQEDGRTVDVQSLQRQSINGGTEVYGQTESVTVKVNATTTRITTRQFVTNSDGQKVLNGVTVEEKRELPDGAESVLSTVSRPDADGKLQVMQREVQQSEQNGPGVRTTNTTVLLPGPDGALAPSTQIHEVQKQLQPGISEYTRSLSLRSGDGNWQVNEVRQGTIQKSGSTETKQENVSRLNADGQMAVMEKTVSKETKTDSEQRKEVQKFSTTMGDASPYPDGQMHLDRQLTTVTRTGPGGEQVSEQQVNERSPAAPDEGLRLSQRVLDITRPGLEGVKQQTVTIESASPNGGMNVVWVNTGKLSGNGPVTVETKQPPAPKPSTAPH
jgi:hypothetical protein